MHAGFLSRLCVAGRRVTAAGLVAAAAWLAVPAPVSAEDAARLLDHFESVVFGSEYGTDAGDIRKWMSPIRVSVTSMRGEMRAKPGGGRELKLAYEPPAPERVEMIRRHLTTLVRLTGAVSESSDADNGKPANFLIRFVPRLAMGQPFLDRDADPALLRRLAAPGVCYFLTRAIRSGAMFRALIVVNAELPPERMDACLLEEMTQAMGLPNDSDLVSPSIFNQASTRRTLSETDKLLIKVLYDRRLPAGTPKADAMRIAERILGEQLAAQ